jgi:predicted permease
VVPYAVAEQIRSEANSFAGIFLSEDQLARKEMLFQDAGISVPGERVRVEPVSGAYFTTLGITASVGRVFLESEDQVEAPAVAVISNDFWRTRYGSAPDVAGTRVRLQQADGTGVIETTIIGVAPEGFYGVDVDADPDVWLPFMPHWAATNSMFRSGPPDRALVRVMGRLRPGVTVAEAQGEIDVFAASGLAARLVEEALLDSDSTRIVVQTAGRGYSEFRAEYANPLYILITAAVFVLLIACANVTALLLARGTSRRTEVAVRLAMGSGRLGIARLLLGEGLLLAAAGGVLALFVANWSVLSLTAYLPAESGLTSRIAVDARVILFTAGVAFLSVFLFALLPGLRVANFDLSPPLKGSHGRLGLIRSDVSAYRGIVVAQVALSFVLLVGAGLFLRTVQTLRSVDTGFDRQNVIQFEIQGAPGESLSDFVGPGLERLAALPGVQSATTYARTGLLSGENAPTEIRAAEDILSRGAVSTASGLTVGPRFFETMGISLISGRGLGGGDVGASVRSAVISHSLARHLFGTEDPVGRRLFWLQYEVEIVGVAEDVTHVTLRDPGAWTIYFPQPSLLARLPGNSHFALRTEGRASDLASAIQAAVREINDEFRATQMHTLHDVREAAIVRERFVAQLASAFGIVALALAAVGVYGVLSYTVTQRTSEIGIRMALGAQASQVMLMFMHETMKVVLVGVAAGLPIALAAMRFVATLLFGVTPANPSVIAVAAMTLVSAAVVAAYLPARRAARLDPLRALRHE